MADPDFARPAAIGTLVIHGVGLIGGSLGMAAKRSSLARDVVGVGRDATRLDAAVRLGAIDRFVVSETCDGLHEACAQGDLIVLCTPVSNIIDDLPGVLAAAKSTAAVTDVGSVKGAIVEAAAGDPRFVGSHPMAGSELAGIYAARVGLFQEATWALTPVETTNPEALGLVRALAQDVGAVVRILPPDRHDEAVALTSHLPHVLAYALMALAAERACANGDIPYMAAGSFAGATRVAGSLPSLWRDIAASNKSALGAVLRDYRADLEHAQTVIDSGDPAAIEALFAPGYEARRSWPRQ